MNIDLQATLPEIRDTINGVVTNRTCPFCGTADAWMPAADDRVFLVSEVNVTDGQLSEVTARGYAVHWVCDGCGFVRLHIPSTPRQT